MASVFIIHGHDMEARNELVKFVNSLGLEVLEFHMGEKQDRPMSMIFDTVLNGIQSADAVIALFTPDEHSASYVPSTGTYSGKNRNGEKWEGWQARPNVIFEAGIALGIAIDKTIIVK